MGARSRAFTSFQRPLALADARGSLAKAAVLRRLRHGFNWTVPGSATAVEGGGSTSC